MPPAPKPKKRDRDEAYRFWVTCWPCCVCERTSGKAVASLQAECCHVRTKAVAGDKGNCVPLCHAHHAEQHAVGIETFQARYKVRLQQRAAWYSREYDREIAAWRVETGEEPDF